MYKRHRFPPEIIQYAVWLYHRFNLSHRDIEDLLAERGITVSCESIRLWCNKFGLKYVRRLKKRHQGYGDTFFIDEVFVKIDGKQHYLWRAADQDGEIVDVFLQRRRDGKAAKLSLPFIHPRLPSGSIHDGVRRNIVVRLFSRALGLEQVAYRERPSLKTGAFGHCCGS